MSAMDDPDDALEWDEHDQPRSRRYGDLYYSREDGLAESRAVFLTGCDLPNAWEGRPAFCIAELGFGTGLNVAALLDLWQRDRPVGGHLHIFSVEAHPIRAVDAALALRRWPELGAIAAVLVARWPGKATGFHRIDLPEFHATLDLAVMEAAQALTAWNGRADAWFLDGFAPALNPAMWRAEVLDLVAQRSAPDARVASFTVAGAVRRGLADAGFVVERRPGFGRKRERLEGRLAGAPEELRRSLQVAVVGAGIAGASLCRAFTRLGVTARVFDAAGAGAGASGGPAALAAPRLDAGLGPAAALFAQAMRRAIAAYQETPGAILARQALQLEIGPKDPRRFAAIAGSDLFETAAMRLQDAATTSGLMGEAAPPGLLIDPAVVVEPDTVLVAWLDAPSIARVSAITPHSDGWSLFDDAGAEICRADIVCVAAGMASADLIDGLAMTAVRGQATSVEGMAWPTATLFGGYVVPTRGGLMIGATHDRGDLDTAARDDDHARNRAAVRAVLPALADGLVGRRLTARTGIRATTADYLPIAGAAYGAEPGLFVLTGLGSRGYCLAPLLAEHVAAQALGAPSPLPRDLAALVDPARFERRARRKGRQDAVIVPRPA